MPEATPETIPVEATMVAVPVALLVQVPPVTVSASVIEAPRQTEEGPVIAGSGGLVRYIIDPKRVFELQLSLPET